MGFDIFMTIIVTCAKFKSILLFIIIYYLPAVGIQLCVTACNWCQSYTVGQVDLWCSTCCTTGRMMCKLVGASLFAQTGSPCFIFNLTFTNSIQFNQCSATFDLDSSGTGKGKPTCPFRYLVSAGTNSANKEKKKVFSIRGKILLT